MSSGEGAARGRTASRRAKLFWNGRSQAVRLPKEFRFEGDEVEVRREGESVILEPVKKRALPPDYWRRIDHLRGDLEIEEVEPLGGGLLDIEVEER